MLDWYHDLQAENVQRASGMGAIEYRLRELAEFENIKNGNPAPLMHLEVCAADVRRSIEAIR